MPEPMIVLVAGFMPPDASGGKRAFKQLFPFPEVKRHFFQKK
jgi:hypothetical protein